MLCFHSIVYPEKRLSPKIDMFTNGISTYTKLVQLYIFTVSYNASTLECYIMPKINIVAMYYSCEMEIFTYFK